MKSLRILVAILALTLAAQAATITYQDAVGSSTTPLTYTFSLPLFDSSLGNLTGVQIRFTGGWQGVWATVTNTGSEAATYRVQDTVESTVTGSTISTLDLTQVIFNNPEWPSLRSLAPGASDRYPLSGSYNGTISGYATVTAPLSAFVGPGSNLSFALNGDNLGNFTSSGQVGYSQAALVSGLLEITYTYGTGDVPEPATLALLGTSLLGLGLLRRKLSCKA